VRVGSGLSEEDTEIWGEGGLRCDMWETVGDFMETTGHHFPKNYTKMHCKVQFFCMLITKYSISDVGTYKYHWPILEIDEILLRDKALIYKKLSICSFIRFGYFICPFIIIEMLYIVI
jgi:hypothetical protein